MVAHGVLASAKAVHLRRTQADTKTLRNSRSGCTDSAWLGLLYLACGRGRGSPGETSPMVLQLIGYAARPQRQRFASSAPKRNSENLAKQIGPPQYPQVSFTNSDQGLKRRPTTPSPATRAPSLAIRDDARVGPGEGIPGPPVLMQQPLRSRGVGVGGTWGRLLCSCPKIGAHRLVFPKDLKNWGERAVAQMTLRLRG